MESYVQKTINENFSSFETLNEDKKPGYNGITNLNIFKRSFLELERSDYKEAENVFEIDYFLSLIKYIQHTSVFSLDEKKLKEFQFGITKFKNSPKFCEIIEKEKGEKDIKEEKTNTPLCSVWNKAILAISIKKYKKKTGFAIFKILSMFSIKLSDKFAQKNIDQNIDRRISSNIDKNIWVMEKLNLKNDQKNIILDFIFETEPLYREKTRDREFNQQKLLEKEMHFNHFLRVMRIGLGILDSFKYKKFAGSDEDNAKLQNISQNPKELFKLTLKALAHDLIEDRKLSKKELINLLNEITKNYPNLNIPELAEEIANSADRLNSHNYKKEDGTRDYETFLFGNPAKNVRPLTLQEKIVKISDIFHNYQTPINMNFKEKIDIYSQFIGQNIELVKLLPDRIIKQVFYNNPSLLKYDGWEKVYRFIKK